MTSKRQTALEVIAAVAGREASVLEPEAHLVADLGIDSPTALKLLVELEEKLDVEITDEEAAKLETVGDIVTYAESLEG